MGHAAYRSATMIFIRIQDFQPAGILECLVHRGFRADQNEIDHVARVASLIGHPQRNLRKARTWE